jgi:hypothetical protein
VKTGTLGDSMDETSTTSSPVITNAEGQRSGALYQPAAGPAAAGRSVGQTFGPHAGFSLHAWGQWAHWHARPANLDLVSAGDNRSGAFAGAL